MKKWWLCIGFCFVAIPNYAMQKTEEKKKKNNSLTNSAESVRSAEGLVAFYSQQFGYTQTSSDVKTQQSKKTTEEKK